MRRLLSFVTKEGSAFFLAEQRIVPKYPANPFKRFKIGE